MCTQIVVYTCRLCCGMAVKQLPGTSSSTCACGILLTAQPSVGRVNGVGNSNAHVPVFNALLPSAGVVYTTAALV